MTDDNDPTRIDSIIYPESPSVVYTKVKPWYTSVILWLGVIDALIAGLDGFMGTDIVTNTDRGALINMLIAILIVVRRFFTTGPISWPGLWDTIASALGRDR